MALTATATITLRKEIAQIISLKDEAVITMSPDRSNIVYSVLPFVTLAQTFSPLISAIIEKYIKGARGFLKPYK